MYHSNSNYLDQRDSCFDVAFGGVGVGADELGFLQQLNCFGAIHAGDGGLDSDLKAETAIATGADANGGLYMGIGWDVDFFLTSNELHSTEEASCVASGKKLLWVVPLAIAAHLFGDAKLDVEALIGCFGRAITATGSAGCGFVNDINGHQHSSRPDRLRAF